MRFRIAAAISSSETDVLLCHLEREVARVLDGDAVSERDSRIGGRPGTCMEGIGHRGGTLRLHAIHLARRLQALDSAGDAGDEAAATDRHDHGIHIVERVHDLEADRALAGDDILVVVGVDERGARLLLETHGLVVRIVVGAGDKSHLGAEPARVLDLHDRGTIRHADDALDAHVGRGECDALGMVSGRAGDDALVERLLRKLRDLVVGAPQLEGAGDLQVLRLEIELVQSRHELRCRNQVRLPRNALEDIGCMVDLVER